MLPFKLFLPALLLLMAVGACAQDSATVPIQDTTALQPAGSLQQKRLTKADVELKTGEKIWSLAVRERGLIIEAKAGGNLPTNFPVIDKEIGNVISSIKSVDLTSKTYQKVSGLRALLNGFLKDSSEFNGSTYSGKTVMVGSSTTKNLDLFYQTGKASQAQLKIIEEFQKAASAKGIDVIIKTIK